MELRACIEAYKVARRIAKETSVGRVIIVSDSLYVVDNAKRAQFWRKNGWRNQEEMPIENPDLWRELLSVSHLAGVRVDLRWQKGKSTDVLKEVDKKAKEAGKSGIGRTDFGYHPGKISSSKVGKGRAVPFSAINQEETVHVYRKMPAGSGSTKEHKVFFDLFSEEENMYSTKYYAYVSLDLGALLCRRHCYRVLFNNNSRYPRVEKILNEMERCPDSVATELH